MLKLIIELLKYIFLKLKNILKVLFIFYIFIKFKKNVIIYLYIKNILMNISLIIFFKKIIFINHLTEYEK